MPEPTSPVAAERPAEPLVYRPVSGLAIAGFIFAALFTGLVLLSVLVALVRRESFYLQTWMYPLALAGGVLSFLALRQIRASEGTRAGTPLARLGLWLSILCGLGSGIFSWVTGLALRQQANRFLMEKGPDAGFFPLLQEGNVNAAFLLARPPEARRQANPNSDRDMEKFFDLQLDEKEPRGGLSIFRTADFVQLLGQPYDTPTEVVPLGVKDWRYEAKGYTVERTYQIRNPEGRFDLPLRVQSIESSVPGEGRKWMVVWGPMHPPLKVEQLTPLGEKMSQLRESAAAFGSYWLAKLAAGDLFVVYAGMMDAAQRTKLSQLHTLHLQAATVSLLTAAPGDPRPLLGPNLCQAAALVSGSRGEARKGDTGPVVAPHLRVRGEDQTFREAIVSAAARLGHSREPILRAPPIKPEQARYARWQKKDGRLEIALSWPFRGLARLLAWQKKDGRLEIALDVIVEIQPDSKKPAEVAVVLGKLILAADAEADPAQTPFYELWRVVRLELDLARPKQLQPGGPGALGGPLR
jgi:hypothetical protein